MGGYNALGGLASLGGSGITAAAAARQAKKQRQWQERMYKNRHTYETADLERAGLNRILSITQPAAGGVPSGAKADVPDFGKAVGVTTAAQLGLLKAQTEATTEQGRKAGNEADLTAPAAAIMQKVLGAGNWLEEMARDIMGPSPNNAEEVGKYKSVKPNTTRTPAGWKEANQLNLMRNKSFMDEEKMHHRNRRRPR